jgi:hypothetical protein
MKYALSLFAAIAMAFAPAASAQSLEENPPLPESVICQAPCSADTTHSENVIDPEMVVRPDTTVDAKMRVVIPSDSLDPEMVHDPQEAANTEQLLQKLRGKQDEKGKQ